MGGKRTGAMHQRGKLEGEKKKLSKNSRRQLPTVTERVKEIVAGYSFRDSYRRLPSGTGA